MRFIGELYLIDLISQKVMLKILPTLLGEVRRSEERRDELGMRQLRS